MISVWITRQRLIVSRCVTPMYVNAAVKSSHATMSESRMPSLVMLTVKVVSNRDGQLLRIGLHHQANAP